MQTKGAEALAREIRTRARSVTAGLDAAALMARALERREGRVTADGALAVTTGPHTGRSAKDKFIVRDAVGPGGRHRA
jgi:phosphoenolpyruvate carboxykinase (ATP)